MPVEPDDLFTPTLTEADDALDFDRPWNPWSLLMLTFFFGLAAGGGLLAFNFERLGMRRRLVPTLLLVGVATVALAACWGWLAANGRVGLEDRDTARMARWIGRAVSLGIAGLIAWPQHRRYRLFQHSSLPHGHLLKPALAAIAVSLVLEVGLAAAFFALLRA